MQKIHVSLAVSLAILTFIVGLGSGYFISPDYQRTMFEKPNMGLGAADRFIDLRYINAMAAHHRGAILLANQIATTSTRPEITTLAVEIQKNEPTLIEELYEWKKNWYADTSIVIDPIVPILGQTDEKIDLRFLNALIAHHEAGIEMTQEIRSKSSNAEILNNADAVETFLANSLVTLRGWRTDWYGVNKE
jgi:uncharacterized protein (DUF305 family)